MIRYTTLPEAMRKLREQSNRQRAKLLEIAQGCNECGGGGIIDIVHQSTGGRVRFIQVDCPECADIRELITP